MPQSKYGFEPEETQEEKRQRKQQEIRQFIDRWERREKIFISTLPQFRRVIKDICGDYCRAHNTGVKDILENELYMPEHQFVYEKTVTLSNNLSSYEVEVGAYYYKGRRKEKEKEVVYADTCYMREIYAIWRVYTEHDYNLYTDRVGDNKFESGYSTPKWVHEPCQYSISIKVYFYEHMHDLYTPKLYFDIRCYLGKENNQKHFEEVVTLELTEVFRKISW